MEGPINQAMVFQYADQPMLFTFSSDIDELLRFALPGLMLHAGEISGSSPLPDAVTSSAGISSFFTPGL